MKRRTALAVLLGVPLFGLVTGCVSGPGQFAKGDIDRMADLHRRELTASLRRLAEKLYRRNPREWKKGGHASLDAAVEQLFDPERIGLSPDPAGRRSTSLLLASLNEAYAQDRVAAFIAGLNQMVHDAFDGKFELYLLDDLDAQKLYNAARNVEIAAWKLSNSLRTQPEADIPVGAPILFSNEIVPIRNLSFEREFGRMIGNLDLLSITVGQRTQRIVVKTVQNLASAIFLPI